MKEKYIIKNGRNIHTVIYLDFHFVYKRLTRKRGLTLLVGVPRSLATFPRESQNLLRTKSRLASTASLRDNFSRAVTLNTKIFRLWTEFQVPQYSRRSPKILSGRDARSPVDFDYRPVHLTSSSCRLFISHRTIISGKLENADIVAKLLRKIFAAR